MIGIKFVGMNIIISLISFLILIGGCKMDNNSWVGTMIAEMESAWIEADKAGRGQKERDGAVNAVVQRYLKPGVSREEAFRVLTDLKGYGFDVGEYRHDGARKWPDGEFKLYADEETKRNFQTLIPRNASRLTARKKYKVERIIFQKYVVITIFINDRDGEVSNVEASIWVDSI
ncbi:hypothetical protein [Pseudothauera rhizosphaerae]|uniref:Uncharacterized protein n=1 Tax=Pseudothauera rhizosphaerae TaxID=2565932 RepID=A0A4S4AFX0_9RHOO|nr:hypothetical protein [Pseudothauera rhizosphaerae]THF58105.1 hypothetical protein E6O51_17340 [Pseudothauera rhizosphaerae]